MPHSSGGGSSSGGFHSGSSSSSSESHIKHYMYPGAYKFLRYKSNGTIENVYSDTDITKMPKGVNWVGIILLSPVVLFLLLCTIVSCKKPEKIDTNLYNSEIFIADYINEIEDEEALGEELNKFKDLTGIAVCIETVTYDEWQEKWYNLEDYAYNRYLNRFGDEKHWLLVYSEHGPSVPNEWVWEGMQGDDTDPVLTEMFANKFSRTVQKSLKAGDTFDVAVTKGLDAISKNIMTTPPYDQIAATIFGNLIVCLCGWAFFIADRTGNRSKYIKIPEGEETSTVKCNICHKEYLEGTVPVCPYCFNVDKYKLNPFYKKKVDKKIEDSMYE